MAIINGTTGIDILNGTSGDDTISGYESNDTLNGGDGNDTLVGGQGNDTLDGGTGTDTVDYSMEYLPPNWGYVGVYVNLSSVAWQGLSAGQARDTSYGYDTLINIENVKTGSYQDWVNGSSAANVIDVGANTDNVWAGDGNDTVIGGAGNDNLYGDGGDDTLNGGTENDTIEGGAGNDTVSGDDGNDTLYGDVAVPSNLLVNGGFEQSGSYTNAAFGRNSTTIPGWTKTNSGNFEQVVTTLYGVTATEGSYWLDLDAAGGTGSNMDISQTVSGLSAGQILTLEFDHANRGASADTGSFEVYWNGVLVATITTLGTTMMGESLQVTAIAGNNTVTFRALGETDGVGASLDNVRLYATVGGTDILTGGLGDDLLVGGVGADSLSGGDGTDTISYATSAAGVTVNLLAGTASGGHAQGDTFSGIENITGSSGNDVLTGNAAANILNGGLGADTLAGGQGNDIYIVNGPGDVVIESAGEGTDEVRTEERSYTLTAANVENLTSISTFGVTLTGNAGDNVITGSIAGDTLIGGAGADVLNGAGSNDTADYSTSAAAVTVNLATNVASGGDAAGDTYISIENLNGSAGADTLTGDGGANTLNGLSGNDTLYGAGGNDTLNANDLNAANTGFDTLYGGTGDDTYRIDHNDTVVELAGEGTDTVRLNSGGITSYTLGANFENLWQDAYVASTLTGNTLNNTIGGGLHNETLIGLDGNDTLNGGGGDDILVGGVGGDSLNGGLGVDTADYSGSAAAVTIVLGGASSGGDAAGDTLTGIEIVLGTAGNDSLTGDGADNRFRGGAGADTLAGGLGNDTLDYTGSAAVTVDLAAGTVSGGDGAGDTYSAFESVTGGAGTDTLRGDGGNNTLDGGGGADTLEGRLGNDIYVVDDAADVVTELAAQGTDEVRTTLASYSLAANLENLTGLLTTGQTLTGNSANNAITGGTGNDTLVGGAGADALNGGNGTDTASYVGSAAVTINLGTNTASGGDAAGDTFSSIENVTGTSNNDSLTGNGSDNVLRGGAGADTLAGGSGNDTLDYTGSVGGVTVNLATNSASGGDAAGDVISSMEHATGGNGDDVITGTSGYNVLIGGEGNDTLTGGGGFDWLIGGNGNDILNTGDGDSADGGAGDDNYTGGATNPDSGLGGYYYGSMTDSSGNDTATITADLAEIDSSGVETFVLGDYYWAGLLQGTVLILNTSDNVVITGGAGGNSVFGGTGVDTINAGDGDDFLLGRAGADIINGGNGIDAVAFETQLYAPTIGVTVDLLAGTGTDGDAQGDTYVSIENVYGTHLADVIWGDNGDNLLDGQGGADDLTGRLGNDIYYIDHVLDLANELAGEGTDEVRTNLATYTLGANLENLTAYWNGSWDAVPAYTFTGNGLNNVITGLEGNDSLNGGGGNDTLNGGGGNDTLNGSTGTDTMVGGGGNDTYVVDSATDILTESAGQGTDLVQTALTSYTLTAANVENLTYTGASTSTMNGSSTDNVITGGTGNDTLNGNGGIDTLNGGNGSDTLNGGAGDDVMTGGAGNDTYFVDSGGDQIIEVAGGGTDTMRSAMLINDIAVEVENFIYTGATSTFVNGNSLANVITGGNGGDNFAGNDGNDTLNGLGGGDTLSGGNGNDTITGGAGTDTLTGGANNDTFKFANGDIGLGVNADRVQDFVSGADKLDVAAVDANSLVAGDQAFSFIGSGAFTNVAGQLRYFYNGTDTILQGDTNGDGIADGEIILSGLVTPVVSDFTL